MTTTRRPYVVYVQPRKDHPELWRMRKYGKLERAQHYAASLYDAWPGRIVHIAHITIGEIPDRMDAINV